MITKAGETASEIEQKAKEMANEVKEATPGAVQIIVLALAAGCILVAVASLLFMVAII